MQVAQAGRPGDPREREQDIFENLSDICLCGEVSGWGGIADFSKISQKFASVNEDLRSENLPLVKRKHGPAPRGRGLHGAPESRPPGRKPKRNERRPKLSNLNRQCSKKGDSVG